MSDDGGVAPLPKDPKPGEAPPPERPARRPRDRSREKSGATKRREAAAREQRASTGGEAGPAVTALLTMFARVWEINDPMCGGKLREIAPDVGREVASIVEVDAAAARLFNATIGQPGWTRLGITLLPLAGTLTAHHVAPAIARARERAVATEPEPLYVPPVGAEVLAPEEVAEIYNARHTEEAALGLEPEWAPSTEIPPGA